MVDFTHLHCHSEYSLLDGLSTPEEIIETAHMNGQSSISITDHGAMGGSFRFLNAAEKYGVNGIVGVEAYYVPSLIADTTDKKAERFHLILLAKNQTGLSQLQKVMRRAWTDGHYYKPRIEFADLGELAGDTVCLSGCMASHLSRLLLGGEEQQAEELAQTFKALFGDDYYIEMQPWTHGKDNEHVVLANKLYDLAQSLHIPVVGTMDCHYPTADQKGIEEVLLAMGQAGGFNAAQTRHVKEMSKKATSIPGLVAKINMLMPDRRLRFDEFSPYIMGSEDVAKTFIDAGHTDPAIIENTMLVADKCKVTKQPKRNLLPKYTKTMESNELLTELVFEGLKKRGFAGNKEYIERLNHELQTIKNLNFADYFLIIWDLVNWAKTNGIRVGPGRGSVGGSLLAYSLGIIDIDPIKYGLLFARFINEERNDFPDIDLDFEDKKRYLVKAYLKERWGPENVAGIAVYTAFGAKVMLKDVGKAFGLDYDMLNKMTPLFGNLDDFKIEPKCRELVREHPEILEVLEVLDGRIKSAGAHASGVVISSEPLTNILPVESRKEEKKPDDEEASDERIEVVALDMDEAAELNLIKFDVLGLKTLAIIEDCLTQIKERTGESVENISLGLDDSDVFGEFNNGHGVGIFQAEAPAYQNLLKDMRIRDFNDLAVSNALVRPGALVTQGKSYLAASSGAKAVVSIHPLVDEILAETYGTVIYQEQLMQVAVALAGFSWSEADRLRKIIGKKKAASEFDPFKDKFVTNAGANIGTKKAEKIWKDFEKASEYMFNKSHAVGYSMLSYQTAWLKYHYPADFIWASLVNEKKPERISTLLLEAHRMAVDIVAPDVNTSGPTFTIIDEKTIQFGLTNVSMCGPSAVDEIMKHRPYSSMEEFRAKCRAFKVKSNLVDNLDKVHAFRSTSHVSQYEAEKYYLPVLSYPFYAEQDETFNTVIEKCGDVDTEKSEFHVVRGLTKNPKKKGHYFKVDIEDSTGSVTVFGDKDHPIKAKEYICALVGDKSLVAYCDATQLDDLDNPFVQLLNLMADDVVPEGIGEAVSYGAGDINAGISLGIVLKNRVFKTKKGDPMSNAYIYDPLMNEVHKVVCFPRALPRLIKYLEPMEQIIYKKDHLDKGGYCLTDIIGLASYLDIKRNA